MDTEKIELTQLQLKVLVAAIVSSAVPASGIKEAVNNYKRVLNEFLSEKLLPD